MNSEIIYSKLKNDKEILGIYQAIEEYEIQNKGWAFHNFEHIKNVSNVVEKVLSDLEVEKEVIINSKIACLFHDVGALNGKDNHAERSYNFSKEYFKKNNINFIGMNDVLEAIKIHSDGFGTNNIIALTLIFADKLDIKSSRISEEGKKIVGNRQYEFINDIKIEILGKTLNIDFIVDDKINMEELNNYYFTKKIFKVIKAFSDKLSLNQNITVNGKKWINYYQCINN